MSYEVAEMLTEAFARYEAAKVRVAAGEASRNGADLGAVQDLRHARIALCRALELSGWEPPREVQLQLLHDRNQLARRVAA